METIVFGGVLMRRKRGQFTQEYKIAVVRFYELKFTKDRYLG